MPYKNMAAGGRYPKICIFFSIGSGCQGQNVSEITALRYIKNLSDGYDINNWSDPIYLLNLGTGDSNFAAQINNDGSLIGMVRSHLITASNWKDNTTYIDYTDTNLWDILHK